MAKRARSAKHAASAQIREIFKPRIDALKGKLKALKGKAKESRAKATQQRKAAAEARKAAIATRRAEREQKQRARAAKKHERIANTRKKLVGQIKELKQKLAATYGKVDMLRDTGTLFAALNPTLNPQGGIETIGKVNIEIDVGYGGPARHPKGKATIADVARFHDAGMGNNPKRKIIVTPNEATIAQMKGDADRAMARLIKNAGL